jgi:hypothetical protein
MHNKYFPAEWKFTKIIMLLKADKDHYSPFNYWPVSFKFVKFHERYCRELNFYLKDLNLIKENQHGFKVTLKRA